MSKFWSDIVARLDPYVPGEQPQDQQYIKLNTNESPYPPSPAVSEVLRNFPVESLRRYPDPESIALVEALAGYHKLQPDRVFVGNGSDEVLAHCFQGLLKQDRRILFPDISYSFYPVYCALYQIDFETVPLDQDFRIDVNDYQVDNGGIIIPNPNAPTGIALDLDQVRQLIESNPDSLVVIDEAYVDFGASSAIGLINEYDNLLVVHSFSKSRNLAGIRLGAAFGQPALIEALKRVKNSFNSYPVDSLASAIGCAAISDDDYFQECRERIIRNRNALAAALQVLGFEVFPSSSNFLFVRHQGHSAEQVYLKLKSEGILVRYFKSARIDDCLRMTVGTEDECQKLLAALDKLLGH